MDVQIDLKTGPSRIAIDRPVFRQSDFDRKFFDGINGPNGKQETLNTTEPSTWGKLHRKYCKKDMIENLFFGMFPVIEHWKTYNWKKHLIYDTVAGFSAGVIHLPQGLGFALLAGVPPVFGLYTSFVPGWIYYVFGTSRHLSYGTMAVLSLMIGSFVNKQDYDLVTFANETSCVNASNEKSDLWNASEVSQESLLLFTTVGISPVIPQHHPTSENAKDALRVNAAATLTLAVGLLQAIMSALKLGVVSTFMSLPFVKSFTAGAAVHIIVNQLPFQLGFKVKRASGAFQLPINIYRIGIATSGTNFAALVMSIVCMVFLLFTKEVFNRKMVKKLKFPVPAELIVVVLATVISHFARFDTIYDMRVTGSIPNGFPSLVLPSVNQLGKEDSNFVGTLLGLITEALPIAIIGFALAITMAKLMAERHNYEVDSNRELLAIGLVNGFSSFFGCISSTQAPPRTLVLESCGCKSQLAGLISTLLPFIVVIAAGSLFAALPICVLGSVVSAAMLPLIILEFIDIIRLWSFSRSDCLVWLVCFSATVFIDVGAGLVIGLLMSGFVILFGNKDAKGRLLKRAGSTEIYVSEIDVRTLDKLSTNDIDDDNVSRCIIMTRTNSGNDVTRCNQASECNIAIFRFECSLYFVNAENFKNTLTRCVLKKLTTGGETLLVASLDENTRKKLSGRCCCRVRIKEEPVKENVYLKDLPADRDDSAENTSPAQQQTDGNKSPSEVPIKHVILDFSRISDVDITGMNALKGAIKKLEDNKISVSICCCPEKSRKRLEAAGIIAAYSSSQWEKTVPLFPSILDAHAFCMGQVSTLRG